MVQEKSTVSYKKTAMIGMSPGNSYFKKEIIDTLLKTTSKLFNEIIIMIPDKPGEYTNLALGYPKKKAIRNARLDGNNLKNNCYRSIEKIENINELSITVLDWTHDIEQNAEYNTMKDYIYNLYSSNEQFFIDSRVTTKKVIEKKVIEKKLIIEPAIDTAVHYLLNELAFVITAPKIYNLEKLTYIYHLNWEIFEKLISGFYDGIKRNNVSFLIISVD